VYALCILHNTIAEWEKDDYFSQQYEREQEKRMDKWRARMRARRPGGSAAEIGDDQDMGRFRDSIAKQMWQDYLHYTGSQ
jgi:hypothetical protein